MLTGTSEIMKILCTVFRFRGFLYFGLDRLLQSILDPLGLLFGSLLAPKMAETSPQTRLGAAKSRSRGAFFRPRAIQERSKRPPRPFQEAFRRPRSSKRHPGSHLGPILTPFGPISLILEPSRTLQQCSKRPPEGQDTPRGQ